MGRVELDFQSTCTSRARSDHHGRGCYISGVECEACLRWSEGLLDLLARGEESIVDKETKRVADPDIHDELPHVNSTQFALELHVNAASMVPLENEMVENKDAEKFREKMPLDNIVWDEELASDGNTHDGLLQQLAEVEDQTQYKKVCTVLSESEAQVYDEILGKVVWDEEMSSELDMDNDLLGLLVSGGEYPVDEQVVDDSSDFKEFGLVDADHVFVEGLDEDSKAVCKASMSDELTLEINTPFLFGVAIDHVNEMPVNINLQDGLSQERASGREYVYDDKMDPIVEPDFDLSFAVSIQEEWDIQSLVRVPEQDLILKICEQYHGGQPIVLTCQYMIQTDHHFGGTRKGDNEQRGEEYALQGLMLHGDKPCCNHGQEMLSVLDKLSSYIKLILLHIRSLWSWVSIYHLIHQFGCNGIRASVRPQLGDKLCFEGPVNVMTQVWPRRSPAYLPICQGRSPLYPTQLLKPKTTRTKRS